MLYWVGFKGEKEAGLGRDGKWTGPDKELCDVLNALFVPVFTPSDPDPYWTAAKGAAEWLRVTLVEGEEKFEPTDEEGTVY